jgi:hypothetical protein
MKHQTPNQIKQEGTESKDKDTKGEKRKDQFRADDITNNDEEVTVEPLKFPHCQTSVEIKIMMTTIRVTLQHQHSKIHSKKNEKSNKLRSCKEKED